MHENFLKEIGKNDAGSTYELITRPTSAYLIGYRKEGATFGNHWHTGKSESKNPEVFILITGKVDIELNHVETGESKKMMIKAPFVLEIEPYWKHTLKAIQDISFLELNSLDEHQQDTNYP